MSAEVVRHGVEYSVDDSLPPPAGVWVRVTERLPEPYSSVPIWDEDYKTVGTAWWSGTMWYLSQPTRLMHQWWLDVTPPPEE